MHNSSVKEYSIPFDELSLTPVDVLTVIGYDDQKPPAYVHEVMQEVFEAASSMCTPCGGYSIIGDIAIDENRHTIRIGSPTFSIKKMITSQIRPAELIAVFACTAGPQLEDWSRKLLGGEDPAKGYMVDTLASMVVETAMDKIHDKLEKEFSAAGQYVSNRFSPGYCGWPLSDIHDLFSLLPTGYCDIRLNEAAFMIPEKSICGIIGIGTQITRSEYLCSFCEQKDCIYRNKYTTRS